MADKINFRVFIDGEFKYFNILNIARYPEIIEKSILNGLKFQQYTGLKDRDGKDVYIGDILLIIRAYNEFTGLDIEEIGSDKYEVKEKEILGFYLDSGMIGFHNIIEYEIIGNIYENKDLLSNDNQ